MNKGCQQGEMSEVKIKCAEKHTGITSNTLGKNDFFNMAAMAPMIKFGLEFCENVLATQ